MTIAPALQSPPRDLLFPAIVENMRDGVLAFDNNGNLITANDPACEMLGFDDPSALGGTFAEMVLMREELWEINDAIVESMYAANNVVTRDVTFRIGREERHIVVRTSMLRDERSGQPLGVVVILSDVSEKMRSLRERIEFGHLVVLFIGLLGLANIVTLFVQTYDWFNVYSTGFAWAYLILITLPVAYTVWHLKLAPSQIGITLQGWRRAVFEGVAASAVAIAVIYALSHLMREGTVPGEHATMSSMSVGMVILSRCGYALHSLIQEVMARGVLQTSLRRLLDDRSGVRSLLVASLIFGLFHSHFGLMAVAVTAISGVVMGAMYMRHGNLIGVTILHVAAGIAAFQVGIL